MFSSHASRVLASSSSTTTTTRRGARTTRSFPSSSFNEVIRKFGPTPTTKNQRFSRVDFGNTLHRAAERFDPCVALKKVVVSRGRSRSLLFRKKARRCVASVDKSGEENQSYLFSLHVFRVYHALSFPFKNQKRPTSLEGAHKKLSNEIDPSRDKTTPFSLSRREPPPRTTPRGRAHVLRFGLLGRFFDKGSFARTPFRATQ